MIRHRFTVIATLTAILFASGTSDAQTAPTYEVFAIRYATVPSFPVRALIAGADTSRRMDIAMSVWLLRGNRRNVLVDAGFYRDKFVTRWKPANFVQPSEAVKRAGVRPEDVTDIIVSHVHWDHADGIDLFPKARVWIQKEEYEHYVAPDGTSRDRAMDPDDAKVLADLKAHGHVNLDRRRLGRDHPGHYGIHRRQAHIRLTVRDGAIGRRHRRDRVGQCVPVREPRTASADRADARFGVEPRGTGADGSPRIRAEADHSGPRSGGVRQVRAAGQQRGTDSVVAGND